MVLLIFKFFKEYLYHVEEPSDVGELSPTSQIGMVYIRRTGEGYEL